MLGYSFFPCLARPLASFSWGHPVCRYHWLPLSSARALICLISAVLYAFTGKTQQAVDEITKGEAAVSEHLAELGVRHEEISEAALDPLTLWSSRPPLVLSLQLAVARAHLHLATSNLQGAQEAVLAVLSQVMRFPHQLRSLLLTAHMVAGHYAHAVGSYGAATAHFQAVKQNTAVAQQATLASALLALSLVSSPDSGEREVEAAIDALGPRFGAAPLTSQPEESLEGVVSMLAVALIKLRQGRGQEAAARLRTVLQAAHHRLMHHGLVAQVMAYLVPHQLQQSDLSAAEQMISAGLKMCKGIRSISTEAHLLAMDQQVCNAKGDQARAARLAQRHATKTAELRALLRAASSGNVEGHEFILTWGLQQKA
ncbi:hypothetical protein V8C86DRAFT_2711254 [Haematococcus lacustris]